MKKLMNILLPASMVLGLTTPLYAEEKAFAEVSKTTEAATDTEKEASTKDELVKAVTDAKDGTTIKLTQNIELDETLNIVANKNITIDLNGKNLTSKKGSDIILMNVTNSDETGSHKLLLTDSAAVKGKIESSESKSMICVRKGAKVVTRNVNLVFNDENHGASNSAIQLQGELKVETGSNITSTEGGITIIQKGSQLDVNDGNIVAEYYAVAGNGSEGLGDTVININGGTLKANNGAGIFHPQKGTLTLNGGTITGLTGVQMCSGNLVVPETSTVKVIANGIDDRVNKTDDGNIDDGRAISLVNRSYPGGAPTANIAGGSFVSEKTDESILAYSWNPKEEGEAKYPEWNGVTADGGKTTVSGGQFNKPFASGLVDNNPFLKVDNTYYVVSVVKGQDALNNLAKQADTSIEIIKNVTELNNVPGGVTVDNNSDKPVEVNGNKLEVNSDPITIPTTSGGGATVKLNPVYRAYNPNNGEHLYTVDEKEYKHVASVGWDAEGVAFMAEEEKNGQALYRVYNPNSGLHHYTLDEKEKNTLVALGWRDEKVAWYTSKKPQSAPVFRVYNPNDGNHHYTMNKQEKDALVSFGWHDEGLAFRTAPIEK